MKNFSYTFFLSNLCLFLLIESRQTQFGQAALNESVSEFPEGISGALLSSAHVAIDWPELLLGQS